MSRIGRLAIKLDPKTKVSVNGQKVSFEGAKGKMSVLMAAGMKIENKDGALHVIRPDASRHARALHGLTRSILANAAKGVTTGWERKLDIRGVGFRAEVKGKALHMALGFSHP